MIVVGEQIGSAGELRSRRGIEVVARRPDRSSATCAIRLRASGGPPPDPSSAPGESPCRPAAAVSPVATTPNVVARRPRCAESRRPRPPTRSIAVVRAVRHRRSPPPTRHHDDGVRGAHDDPIPGFVSAHVGATPTCADTNRDGTDVQPQPSSSSRSSSMPAAWATSWITVTYTSSSSCSRSSQASHERESIDRDDVRALDAGPIGVGHALVQPEQCRLLVIAFADLHHDVVEHVVELGRQGVERLAHHAVEAIARHRIHQRRFNQLAPADPVTRPTIHVCVAISALQSAQIATQT